MGTPSSGLWHNATHFGSPDVLVQACKYVAMNTTAPPWLAIVSRGGVGGRKGEGFLGSLCSPCRWPSHHRRLKRLLQWPCLMLLMSLAQDTSSHPYQAAAVSFARSSCRPRRRVGVDNARVFGEAAGVSELIEYPCVMNDAWFQSR